MTGVLIRRGYYKERDTRDVYTEDTARRWPYASQGEDLR